MNGIGFSPSRVVSSARAPIAPRRETPAWQPEAMMAAAPRGVRWDLADMPLSVWIDSPDEDNASQPFVLMGMDEMLDALREWERASEGRVRFIPAQTPDCAAITLSWSDESLVGRDYEVGHTRREVRSQERIIQATITLMRAPLIDQTLLPCQRLQRLRTAILHEGGHALGLEHSGCHDDVMHHRGWRNLRLSSGDRAQLAQLYP